MATHQRAMGEPDVLWVAGDDVCGSLPGHMLCGGQKYLNFALKVQLCR